MNCREALKQLESFGSEQTRKTYRRHGVDTPMFGVSYKTMGLLKKQIKIDHALAEQLWASGNHDARVLATMIADPAEVDAALANAWIKEVSNTAIACAFADLVGHSRLAKRKADQWIKSKDEWIGRTGWLLVAGLAKNDPSVDDAYFADLLPVIEKRIHTAKNWVREAMNGAVITIGVRSAPLRKLAVAAAKRIGKVEVDHGDTACKTPDASEYIAKTVAYRRKKSCGAMP
jgi:3-methyladenine DNA glycosylase AlkD